MLGRVSNGPMLATTSRRIVYIRILFGIRKYRIAGNFQGIKLSRICPKIIFMELIFANFIILPFCTVLFIIFANFISQISKNRENSESYWPRKFPAIRYTIHSIITVIIRR